MCLDNTSIARIIKLMHSRSSHEQLMFVSLIRTELVGLIRSIRMNKDLIGNKESKY